MFQSVLEWIVDHSDPHYILYWIFGLILLVLALLVISALFPRKGGGLTTKDELDHYSVGRDLHRAPR